MIVHYCAQWFIQNINLLSIPTLFVDFFTLSWSLPCVFFIILDPCSLYVWSGIYIVHHKKHTDDEDNDHHDSILSPLKLVIHFQAHDGHKDLKIIC